MAKGDGSDQSIRIKIEAVGDKRINAVFLADTIRNFQNTLFSVCEYIEGRAPKSCGDFSGKVRESCELEISGLQIGSAAVVLSLPTQTATLGGDGRTLGQRSLDLTKELIADIGADDFKIRVEKRIPKAVNRKRILENLGEVAPASETYKVNFSDKRRHGRFDYKSKQRIASIIPKLDIPDSRKLTGWLMELRVDGKKSFKIDTSEGIFNGNYTPAVEKFFMSNLKGLVELEGKPSKDKKDFIEITPESNITKIEKYPISSFKVGDKLYTLKDRPLLVDIDFDERKYILSEGEFGLLVTADNIKDGITGIKTQLTMLWAAYVECPESKLNEGAKKLRERLKDLVK